MKLIIVQDDKTEFDIENMYNISVYALILQLVKTFMNFLCCTVLHLPSKIHQRLRINISVYALILQLVKTFMNFLCCTVLHLPSKIHQRLRIKNETDRLLFHSNKLHFFYYVLQFVLSKDACYLELSCSTNV